MSFAILGLGTALPDYACTLEQSTRIAQALCQAPEQRPVVASMYRQTEISRRHSVVSGQIVDDVLNGTQHSQSVFLPTGDADDRGPTTRQRMQVYVDEAGPLACRASRQALDESGLAPDDITHIVTVSCTGFTAPGLDCRIIEELGLRPTVERTHVGFMGCHGAINGLRVARAYAGSEPRAKILLCAVELCSVHYHYGWDPKRVVANALFADGAAAVVGVPAQDRSAWQVAATGSCLFPDSDHAMTWDIGDHGFEMTLSSRVPNLIEAHLRPWLEAWLNQHDLDIARIGSWAIHPGGPRVLNSVGRALDIDTDVTAVSREVLAECGNMSSPTVLFILDRLRRRNALRPCVALGFGPGLIVEAVLIR